MPIEVKEARPEDATYVHAIIQGAFAEYRDDPAPTGALRETLAEVEQAISEGNVLLAWDGEQLVGTVRYHIHPDHIYIARLAVPAEQRRRRIATRLLRHIEGRTAECQQFTLKLGTRLSKPGNLTFFKRLGYRIESTKPHSSGLDMVVTLVRKVRPSMTGQQIEEKLGTSITEITDLQQLGEIFKASVPPYEAGPKLEPDILPQLLWEKVGRTLSSCVGKRLEQVFYGLLQFEREPDEIGLPDFRMGGEVELRFYGEPRIFLCWSHDGSIGWDSHYFIEAAHKSFFTNGALEAFDAEDTPIWRLLIGTDLQSIDILSDEEAPEWLKLTFVGGTVYIGSPDIDEVLVRSEEEVSRWEIFPRQPLLTIDSQTKGPPSG